jgi:hypothetical protein
MPGPGSATYLVSAAATANVPSTSSAVNGDFTPGALPQPVIDSLSIANGQYFALFRQVNNQQNGIWFADANGPVPVMTVATGLNPGVEVTVTGGTQNNNTNWVYTAVSHDGGPGFTLV